MSASGRRIAVRYPIVGFLNFVFSILIFWFLSEMLTGLTLRQLVLFTSLISIPISHKMQRTFVWTTSANYRGELIKFSVATVFGTLANILLINQFERFLSIGVVNSQIVLSLCIIAATFLIHYFWTFSNRSIY
jgi:putative flippase GtrA